MEPLHVILDLDETLIHSRLMPFEDLEHDFIIDPDDCGFLCHVRPGAHEFVGKLLADERFAVGVYTAASAGYAQTVIDELMGDQQSKLTAVLTRERTTTRFSVGRGLQGGGWDVGLADPHETYQEKTLRKYLKSAKSQRQRTIALDDSPKAWRQSYGNLLRVPEFLKPEPDDLVLKAAFQVLEVLASKPDVRPIEKRGAIVSFVQRLERSPHSFDPSL